MKESKVILGEGPKYPKTVEIKSLKPNFDDYEGSYIQQKTLYSNKTTWKNSMESLYLFNAVFLGSLYNYMLDKFIGTITNYLGLSSEWCISTELGKVDNSSIKVYGWNYYDDNYIWPDNKTLFITGECS